MKNDEKLKAIAHDALEKMYNEAEPSGDFLEWLNNPQDAPEKFYHRHYLPEDRVKEIFEEVCEENNLRKMEKKRIRPYVILNFSPSSNRERVEEVRGESIDVE